MKLVSVHGGHSGQFCNHAKDSLESIILEYINQGFAWVGIIEHMPAAEDVFVYDDDLQLGMTAEKQWARFEKYITECRKLQKKYSDKITIYVGMETETYSHSKPFIDKLITSFHPDYLVGSVHHVAGICFDASPVSYTEAARNIGGIDALYIAYFDTQFEMLKQLEPAVVGHFDLIRIFDENYKERIQKPEIWKRIERNLQFISQADLILDYNQRALLKGADEAYISTPILKRAIELGIAIVPGDDSHNIDSVGGYIKEAIDILQKNGAQIDWKKPVKRSSDNII